MIYYLDQNSLQIPCQLTDETVKSQYTHVFKVLSKWAENYNPVFKNSPPEFHEEQMEEWKNLYTSLAWPEPDESKDHIWLNQGLGNVKWYVVFAYAITHEMSLRFDIKTDVSNLDIINRLYKYLIKFPILNNTLPYSAEKEEDLIWSMREKYLEEPGTYTKRERPSWKRPEPPEAPKPISAAHLVMPKKQTVAFYKKANNVSAKGLKVC